MVSNFNIDISEKRRMADIEVCIKQLTLGPFLMTALSSLVL